ncbi:MAG TPA: M20/M25/M40 family metallo-hydrolase [Gaiellaceae bacterium]|nr:M20/M25/M40 family metallo-hydrolase [Gaiellaceae bacterium]
MTEVAELAAALVAIDSVNPGLVDGGAGEREIAAFVAGWCGEAGLDVDIVEPVDGRPSIVATAHGSGGGRSLMLNGHLDTVSVDAMDEPFSARIDGGRIYGRGSYDMKGALAAAMLAVRDAARERLAGDVVLAAVADEELDSIGTSAVVERLQTDAAIVCEPTGLRVATAHRGFVAFEIETKGVAAHGSMPHLGDDAIGKIAPVLTRIAERDESLGASTHSLLKSGSVHASLISGGQDLFSYAERCVLGAERRTLPGEDVEQELRDLAGDASLRVLVAREAFEIDPGHELVTALLAATGETEVVGMPFWTDAGLTAAAGIPTVLYGPSGTGAHAAVEWVEIASLERCREVYLTAALHWSR